jgi:hypothetical protein
MEENPTLKKGELCVVGYNAVQSSVLTVTAVSTSATLKTAYTCKMLVSSDLLL